MKDEIKWVVIDERSFFEIEWYVIALLGTNHIPTQGMFEDENSFFPFGGICVSFPEGKLFFPTIFFLVFFLGESIQICSMVFLDVVGWKIMGRGHKWWGFGDFQTSCLQTYFWIWQMANSANISLTDGRWKLELYFNLSTWRIIPFSKCLIAMVSKSSR